MEGKEGMEKKIDGMKRRRRRGRKEKEEEFSHATNGK